LAAKKILNAYSTNAYSTRTQRGLAAVANPPDVPVDLLPDDPAMPVIAVAIVIGITAIAAIVAVAAIVIAGPDADTDPDRACADIYALRARRH
jgi:hypothetical protein